MDMLVYMEDMLKNADLQPVLQKRAEQVLGRILITSCRWKQGSANLKIRKAAVICMIHMIGNGIITSKELIRVGVRFIMTHLASERAVAGA